MPVAGTAAGKGGPLLNDEGELVGLVSSADVDATVVHHGIDICEIRTFLDNHTPAGVDTDTYGSGSPPSYDTYGSGSPPKLDLLWLTKR